MRRAPTLLKPVGRPPQNVGHSTNCRQSWDQSPSGMRIRGRLLVVARNGVFGDVTVVNGTRLTSREDEVAAVVGVCGKDKDYIGLLWVGYKLELPPFPQLRQGIFSDCIRTRFIVEVNGLRGQDSRGD